MKKGVLFGVFILSLIVMTGCVVAESLCAGRGVHGVEIDGQCFDCDWDLSDGICPEDFGVPDCTADGGEEDVDCVGPEQAFWSP